MGVAVCLVVVYVQGDVADGLYIVISGRLRNVVHSEGSASSDSESDSDGNRRSPGMGTGLTHSEMGRGECIGELSVLTGTNAGRECTYG